ncbi:MAG: tryptophan synthase subunit alpha [Thiothrix sp.]|nr:tryptophan synthase subunit alpha [Thiothrix sp.]
MSRIQSRFEQLCASGRRGLIPFITAGDPSPEASLPLMHALVDGGADIIELGVPFSDPMADGPVIQLACERALAQGTSLSDVLDMVAAFRRDDQQTPVVLMGYLNPVEIMGYESFARRAREAGVDGVLIVDLPPEESGEAAAIFRTHALDLIFLLAPTTTDARIRKIAEAGSGYLYYVSLKGVTGASNIDSNEVATRIRHIRTLTDLPLGVGFGIKNAESAASVTQVADAVVVGSALINLIAANPTEPARILAQIGRLLAEMRAAMDAAV